MRTGKIKTLSLQEIAWLEGVSKNTIINNPQRYIPLMNYTHSSRRSQRKYTPLYIRMEDINTLLSLDYVHERELLNAQKLKAQQKWRAKHLGSTPRVGFTEGQKSEIKRLRYEEQCTLQEIAEKYGKCIETIRRVVGPTPRGRGNRPINFGKQKRNLT